MTVRSGECDNGGLEEIKGERFGLWLLLEDERATGIRLAEISYGSKPRQAQK